MAMPFPNDTENLLYLQIPKQNPKKSNLNSFWAFLLSIFVYVSVFYVFNLSPSTDLFCTTKFWFIISNTLILIIAADFSSSKHHQSHKTIHDVVAVTTTTAPAPDFVPLIHHKTMPKYCRQQQEFEVDHHRELEPPEKVINIAQVTENKPSQVSTIHDAQIIKPIKLEKVREKQGKMALQRTLSEQAVIQENEFTKMSNEELNKRVEEFIRKCNRQIRLQAVTNRRRQG